MSEGKYSRRDFLKRVGVVTAGALLPLPQFPPAQEPEPVNPTPEPVYLTNNAAVNTFIKEFAPKSQEEIDKQSFLEKLAQLSTANKDVNWHLSLTNNSGSHTFRLDFKSGETTLTEFTQTEKEDQNGNKIWDSKKTEKVNLTETFTKMNNDTTTQIDAMTIQQSSKPTLIQLDTKTYQELKKIRNETNQNTFYTENPPKFSIPQLNNPLEYEARVTIDLSFRSPQTNNLGSLNILNTIFFSNPSDKPTPLIIQRKVFWQNKAATFSPPKDRLILFMEVVSTDNTLTSGTAIQDPDTKALTSNLFKTIMTQEEKKGKGFIQEKTEDVITTN